LAEKAVCGKLYRKFESHLLRQN